MGIQAKESSVRRPKQPSRPVNISGLFVPQYNWFETRAWHGVLILAENASSCTLTHLEFCKTRGQKLHEFLTLYFTHPTDSSARAVAVVDRAVRDRSQSSSIVSPSVAYQNPTEALDRVHIVGQKDSVATHLSKAYGQYDVLCALKFTSEASDPTSVPVRPPSAIQLSTLVSVVTKHRSNYNLYKYNCYWFANTIFEACKELFSGRENCNKHEHRGQCRLNLPMHATPHTFLDICNEYHTKWREVIQQVSHKTNDGIPGMQELTTRNARDQQRITEAAAHDTVQQELEWKLEEERRIRETAQQRSEELEHKLEEERRVHKAMQQELEHKLEEAERRFQQLRAAKEDRSTHRSLRQGMRRDVEHYEHGSKYPCRSQRAK